MTLIFKILFQDVQEHLQESTDPLLFWIHLFWKFFISSNEKFEFNSEEDGQNYSKNMSKLELAPVLNSCQRIIVESTAGLISAIENQRENGLEKPTPFSM
jgi:hypothetical protein